MVELLEPQPGEKALVALLGTLPAFAECTETSRARLVEASDLRFYRAGDVLVRQGDISDAAYLIVTGEVEVTADSAFGQVHLALLSAKSLIGDFGVFANLPRTATVRAAGAVSALRIGKEALLEVGRENPSLLFSVIGQLGQRIGAVNQAVGFYTNALAALERHDFDPAILDTLLNPLPELIDFAQTFRRMAEQIILRRRQHDEMASATIIQRAMLPAPKTPEEFGGHVEIHAEMRPAREVGGDFYDFLMLDDKRLGFSIGDVCGKGVPASLFMAITQTVMRLVARQEADLATAIMRANDLLCADNASSMFATLFYGVLDLETGRLTFCNCGHNPPFILRRNGGLEPMKNTGSPLAIFEGAPYRTGEATLVPGDRLFLYTDGITEANDPDSALYGDERLMKAMENSRHLPGRELIDAVITSVDGFAKTAPQFDDITCLTLHFRPAK
ncbi:MAG TPA: SpoIIE family protein phosphatase [Parvibaculum sp.]